MVLKDLSIGINIKKISKPHIKEYIFVIKKGST